MYIDTLLSVFYALDLKRNTFVTLCFFFAVFASKRKIDFNVIFLYKVRVVIKIKYAYIKMATFAY